MSVLVRKWCWKSVMIIFTTFQGSMELHGYVGGARWNTHGRPRPLLQPARGAPHPRDPTRVADRPRRGHRHQQQGGPGPQSCPHQNRGPQMGDGLRAYPRGRCGSPQHRVGGAFLQHQSVLGFNRRFFDTPASRVQRGCCQIAHQTRSQWNWDRYGITGRRWFSWLSSSPGNP